MHAPLYFVESIKKIEKAFLHTPLMQRAGQAAAQWAKELKGENPHPIVILAGLGNNGGDALVCATQLLKWQVPIQVIFTGDPKRMPRDAFAALQKFLAAGGTTQSTLPSKVGNISLIVDGLFGIGINRAPDGLYAHLIQWANNIGAPILALDGPSGFLLNNGKALEPAIRAVLDDFMQPEEIFALPERPFFHFKTNRIGLSKEIIAKRNQQKEKAKRNSFADGCIA